MSASSTRSQRPPWVVPVAILAATAVLVVLVVLVRTGGDSGTQSGADSPGQGAAAEVEQVEEPDFSFAERRDDDDLLAAGPVDAPVGLVIFSDYQCPFCASWNADTLPAMMQRAEAGELRIEWRDVNVFGEASERASRASYAAAVQGAFWEYHELLFAEGETRSEQELSDDALIDLAAELGLDTDRFAQDLESEQTREQIAANARLGLELGAHSTPTFILGGQPILGAQPTEVFVDALDDALAAVE